MIPEAREVHLSRKDRKVLEACCRSPVTLQRDLKRARIVLLAATGVAPARSPKKSESSRGCQFFGGTAMPIMALKGCRQAAAGQAADLYEGHRQADSEAAG